MAPPMAAQSGQLRPRLLPRPRLPPPLAGNAASVDYNIQKESTLCKVIAKLMPDRGGVPPRGSRRTSSG